MDEFAAERWRLAFGMEWNEMGVGAIYLGEKVVNEKEYRSAMVVAVFRGFKRW